MILGTGIDAVGIERVKHLGEAFVRKVYSPSEIEQYNALEGAHEDVRAQFLASRFAVKEAYAKARGTGFSDIVVPSDITTCEDECGKPFIELSGKTLDNAPLSAIHLSLTHEMPLAIAMVVLESVECSDGAQ
ncbi:MAG: holo-ACP synthase [Spirochaetales bacterium]|nr:holo-ACP synthase [Spirochaetales bacterium]